MTAPYAAMTPIPTEATTVTQRIRGMKSEITINHPVYLHFEIAVFRCRRIEFRLCGIFNLPALTPAAIDD